MGYAVDSKRQPMVATGVVRVAPEWELGEDGKRRPSDRQARDENTGMPLWEVEVSYRGENFGREFTTTASVTVTAEAKPDPAAYSPIVFEGLTLNAYVNKANGLAERWTAEGISELTAARDTNKGDTKSAASTTPTKAVA
ncbi:hypothetical protein [Nocardioides terrisoli]|uniref:hypothetical protein n=1 Tax=Nocardioides terrisoli TaxID=3388267 RepID=UPI00287B9BAC|nr:hypothetical protein [Nocardioides marmorisolisilvae]